MVDVKKMFCKKVFVKLFLLEQFDVMMCLIFFVVWLVGFVFVFIVVGGVIWGFIGKVCDCVFGFGILIYGGQFKLVILEWFGEVMEVLVEEGDIVEEGQVIVCVLQECYCFLIENQCECIVEMNCNCVILFGLIQDNVELLCIQYVCVECEFVRKQCFVDKQLVLESVIFQKCQQIDQFEQVIFNIGVQLVCGCSVLVDVECELVCFQGEMEVQLQIFLIVCGCVVQVKQSCGLVVVLGILIIDVEFFQEQIEVVFYVFFVDGKKIEVGIEVWILLLMVKFEEYGFIVVEIIEVGSFFESQEMLIKMFCNDVLVCELFGSGVLFQVCVNLLQDEMLLGFKWIFFVGFLEEVFSGILIEVQIMMWMCWLVQMIVLMICSIFGI